MNQQQTWTKRAAALGLAAATVLAVSDARAEYVENHAGKSIADLTMAIGAPVALSFDIASAVYLSSGSGDKTVGLITGIGSLVAGAGLVVGNAFAVSVGGEGNIPVGSPNGPEANALYETRVMAGFGFGMAAASFALGIASLVVIDGEQAAEETPENRWYRETSWRLVPAPMGEDGGGVTLVGTF